MRISRELLRVDEVDSKENNFETSRIFLLGRAGSSGLSTVKPTCMYRSASAALVFGLVSRLRRDASLCCLVSVTCQSCASIASSVHIRTLLYRSKPRTVTSIVWRRRVARPTYRGARSVVSEVVLVVEGRRTERSPSSTARIGSL